MCEQRCQRWDQVMDHITPYTCIGLHRRRNRHTDIETKMIWRIRPRYVGVSDSEGCEKDLAWNALNPSSDRGNNYRSRMRKMNCCSDVKRTTMTPRMTSRWAFADSAALLVRYLYYSGRSQTDRSIGRAIPPRHKAATSNVSKFGFHVFVEYQEMCVSYR